MTHLSHDHHDHQHDGSCGHTALRHGDHFDFLHDGHLHCPHGNHFDERALAIDMMNPAGCMPHACRDHEADHVHGEGCGHDAVPHGDHVDYLVNGHLHHPHGEHCDDHGVVDVA